MENTGHHSNTNNQGNINYGGAASAIPPTNSACDSRENQRTIPRHPPPNQQAHNHHQTANKPRQ